MANSLIPGATTLFLLLLTLTSADTDSDQVVDTDGNPLEFGSKYYIVSALSHSGWIERAPRNHPCPLYVVVRSSEFDIGDPLKFVPVSETQKEIHLSSDIKIDSGRSSCCRSDEFWRVTYDPYTRGDVIIASRAFRVPRSSFRIEKTEGSLNAYMFAYSPPETTSQQQGYLTVFRDRLSGLKLVGLTHDSARAVAFVFNKKKKDVVASM